MATREDQEYSSQAPAPYIGQFLQQGIFPYASQYLDQQFNNLGEANSSPFTYTGQRVAGFDPREQYGMNLADSAIGSYRPYLGAQAGLLDEASDVTRGAGDQGAAQIQQGLQQGRGLTGQAANLTSNAQANQSGRGLVENAMFNQSGRSDFAGGIPNLDLARQETASARPDFGGARSGLARAERSGLASTGSFDPRSISNFSNPYEQQVVDQTMKDVREGLAKGDMGLRDQAVSGGAFGGSRSRLRRGELAEDTARGAAEQIAAIRSGGYQDSANRAQQAFESQQGRQAGFAGQQAGLAGQRAGFAGQEGQAALARGQQFGNLEVQQAQAKMNRGQALNASEQMAVDNQLARGTQLNALDQQQFGNQLQQGQQLGQMGQQQFNMGLQGGQGIAGIGSQMGQGMSQIGQQYGGMGQALQGLQGNDVQSMMGMGGLGRGRQQSLMDLNYQNFTGQYNLPMQTLQNVGALTASLGPMAGGYGYAGGDPTYNNTYAPTGGIGGGVAGGAGNPNAGLPGIYNGAGQGGGNAAGNGFSQPITQQVF